jgi:DNA-binding CsgD family transcriptional regulator
VLTLLAAGHSASEIARRLSLSADTIRWCIKQIRQYGCIDEGGNEC